MDGYDEEEIGSFSEGIGNVKDSVEYGFDVGMIAKVTTKQYGDREGDDFLLTVKGSC